MTPALVVTLVLYSVMLASGQILFKMAAEAAREEGGSFFLALLFEPKFILAVALYGVLTFLWTWILSQIPLSRAYPFVALAFIVTPVLGNLLLGERVSGAVILGTGLVLAGLMVVVYAE